MADTPTPSPSRDKAPEVAMPEPFGYVMEWPAPGGGEELIFSRTDAAGKAIGCRIRNVYVDYQLRTALAERDAARQQSERWQKSVDALRDERDAARARADAIMLCYENVQRSLDNPSADVQERVLKVTGLWSVVKERDATRAEVEQANAYVRTAIATGNKLAAENAALRQELDALRAQEPRAWMTEERPYASHDEIPARLLPPLGNVWPLYARPVQASAGPAETQGWRLVPVEPTLEMVAAGIAEAQRGGYGENIYAAMLAAAPGASPQPAPAREGRLERLKAAIEGECDGLAITDAHALAILQYVDGDDTAREGRQPPEDLLEDLLHEYSDYSADLHMHGEDDPALWARVVKAKAKLLAAHGIGSAKGDEA